MQLDNQVSLVSYGAATSDFKVIARLTNQMNKIKIGQAIPHRCDCYQVEGNSHQEFLDKIKLITGMFPQNVEIFYPSDNYPPHTDEGGLSFLVPLESGVFTIDGTDHSVDPFVLYGFEDGKLHNTDFCAIMLK